MISPKILKPMSRGRGPLAKHMRDDVGPGESRTWTQGAQGGREGQRKNPQCAAEPGRGSKGAGTRQRGEGKKMTWVKKEQKNNMGYEIFS